jgi:hypothetical protein
MESSSSARLRLDVVKYSFIEEGTDACQAVQSTASAFFQAHRHCQQLATHNAKGDARPKAKVAYHCMNELEDDDLAEEESAHENAELSDNENDSDSDIYNVHCSMNVFAL